VHISQLFPTLFCAVAPVRRAEWLSRARRAPVDRQGNVKTIRKVGRAPRQSCSRAVQAQRLYPARAGKIITWKPAQRPLAARARDSGAEGELPSRCNIPRWQSGRGNQGGGGASET